MTDFITGKKLHARKPGITQTTLGRLVYSHPNFTGKIPVGAVGSALQVLESTPDTPMYLGKISITAEPELDFYYFKPYRFENGTVIFEELNIDPDKDYYFYTCSARLRKDFDFFAYAYKDGRFTQTAYVPTGDKLFFCMLLLNFHESGVPSLAEHTFILPNQHLKTSNLSENVKNEMAILNRAKSFVNDSTGCDSMVGVGDRLPIFRRVGITKDDFGTRDLSHTEEYLLLTRGTDNTLSFCVGHTPKGEDFIPENILITIDAASQYQTYEEKLGIANKLVKKYTAGRFIDRYGLHLLEEGAWLPGHYEIITYS